MTQAAIITLADNVADDLNNKQGGWSQSFTAERVYYPKVDLDDTDRLKVHVGAAAWRKAADNRDESAHDFDIEIGVQYRASENAASQAKQRFDELMILVEEISDYYESTRPTLADYVLTDVNFGPGGSGQPYIPEHVEQFNQFTGVIRLTFRKWR